MGKINGVREKLHFPLYDAFYVPPYTTQPPQFFNQFMPDQRLIRFFTDVQNKTRLETNLQAASMLPSMNTFEAHALRLVVSAQEAVMTPATAGPMVAGAAAAAAPAPVANPTLPNAPVAQDQLNFLHALVFNSVTRVVVGEKVMIELPSFWFPAGTGLYPANTVLPTFGEPNPSSSFRFHDPVRIEAQQNFRVELQFPRSVPQVVANARGPLWIWVVLDGYLTRDVQ